MMLRSEYKGYLIRYHFTGAGWFAHFASLEHSHSDQEGCVMATREEGEAKLLTEAKAAIDAALCVCVVA